MTLTEFLLARIREDERAAREAKIYGGTLITLSGWVEIGSDQADKAEAHFARHEPARVLAECVAKRAVVEEAQYTTEQWDESSMATGMDPVLGRATDPGRMILRLLTLPYVDHPDYRQEWRP